MIAIVLTFYGLVSAVLLLNVVRERKNEWRDATIQYKFATLGILKGKTKGEIFNVVGEPTHISCFVDGESLPNG